MGYSYGSNKHSTSEQVAESIYQFLQFFFTEFKDYSDNEFHLAGSSYGNNKYKKKNPLILFTYLFVYLLCKAGHFIPSLAKLIVQKNRYAAQQGRLYIPLQSIMIGNGFFNFNEQQLSNADYSCSTDSKCK
jgi:cathepsin A (carboxypeptidase C)